MAKHLLVSVHLKRTENLLLFFEFHANMPKIFGFHRHLLETLLALIFSQFSGVLKKTPLTIRSVLTDTRKRRRLAITADYFCDELSGQ